MEVKKTNKANLENKKVLFLEIGLAVTLIIAIVAFEYRSFDKSDDGPEVKVDNVAIENIEIPQTENATPPPPADVPPQQSFEFDIVDDEIALDKSINLDDLFGKDINVGPTLGKKEIPEDDNLKTDDEIFVTVEEQAEFPFPGGINGYINSNFVYPEAAKQAGIEGQISVQFVIEKDGTLTDIKILRDIGGGCGEELVKVLKAMPKCKPGKQRGQAVRSQFGMNIRFTLSGS